MNNRLFERLRKIEAEKRQPTPSRVKVRIVNTDGSVEAVSGNLGPDHPDDLIIEWVCVEGKDGRPVKPYRQ